MSKVIAKSYTLLTNSGDWLGQVVLTNDGMFSGVTDYGNFGYSWRHHGQDDFRKFLIKLETDYLGTKLSTGMAYIAHGKKIDAACNRFAEKILPALQKVLQEELNAGIGWEE